MPGSTNQAHRMASKANRRTATGLGRSRQARRQQSRSFKYF